MTFYIMIIADTEQILKALLWEKKMIHMLSSEISHYSIDLL